MEMVASVGDPEADSFVGDVGDGGLLGDRHSLAKWFRSLHAHF